MLAHLPFQRTLEQFDFAFQISIEERLVKKLAKASTIDSWSLPVDVAIELSKSSARARNATPAWRRVTITCSP